MFGVHQRIVAVGLLAPIALTQALLPRIGSREERTHRRRFEGRMDRGHTAAQRLQRGEAWPDRLSRQRATETAHLVPAGPAH